MHEEYNNYPKYSFHMPLVRNFGVQNFRTYTRTSPFDKMAISIDTDQTAH